jgi:hypothetical protein
MPYFKWVAYFKNPFLVYALSHSCWVYNSYILSETYLTESNERAVNLEQKSQRLCLHPHGIATSVKTAGQCKHTQIHQSLKMKDDSWRICEWNYIYQPVFMKMGPWYKQWHSIQRFAIWFTPDHLKSFFLVTA